jgi:hypothetical protein
VSAATGAEEFMSLDFTEIFSLRSEAHKRYRSTFIGQPMIGRWCHDGGPLRVNRLK